MDYNLTDQQQAELIKNWLTKNAKFLSAVLILGLSGFFGGQYLRESNQKQAEQHGNDVYSSGYKYLQRSMN